MGALINFTKFRQDQGEFDESHGGVGTSGVSDRDGPFRWLTVLWQCRCLVKKTYRPPPCGDVKLIVFSFAVALKWVTLMVKLDQFRIQNFAAFQVICGFSTSVSWALHCRKHLHMVTWGTPLPPGELNRGTFSLMNALALRIFLSPDADWGSIKP